MKFINSQYLEKNQNNLKGKIAEIIALIYLIFKGYRIIRYNYQSKLGQIDIIAAKKNCLHFVEVKFRKNLHDIPPVSPGQLRRISLSALSFSQNKKLYSNHDLSIDLIIIQPFKISHFPISNG